MKPSFAAAAEQRTRNIASTEAEQSTGSGVAQPAEYAPHRSTVLQECSDWLQTLPAHVIAHSRPLKRVHSAAALLGMPSTREQRDQIQSLLDNWDVPQKHKGHKRKFDDVKSDLVIKVVEESNRLKTMHNATGPPTPDAPPLPAWVTHSAIQAALLNDTDQQHFSVALPDETHTQRSPHSSAVQPAPVF